MKTKAYLCALYFALHGALERECTYLPKTAKELRAANAKMEEHLLRVPNGEEHLKQAKENAAKDATKPQFKDYAENV